MNTPPSFPHASRLGTMANFYVPTEKLGSLEYGRQGQTPSQLFERFFIEQFGGFTHEESRIQGYWAGGLGKIFTDRHERYEVAVADRAKAKQLFEFLSDICGLLQEQSIYVTYGGRAWLVTPNADHNANSQI